MTSRVARAVVMAGVLALPVGLIPQLTCAQELEIAPTIGETRTEEEVLDLWDARVQGWLDEAKTKGYSATQLVSVQANIKQKGAAKREEFIAELKKWRLLDSEVRTSNCMQLGQKIQKAQMKWDAPETTQAGTGGYAPVATPALTPRQAGYPTATPAKPVYGSPGGSVYAPAPGSVYAPTPAPAQVPPQPAAVPEETAEAESAAAERAPAPGAAPGAAPAGAPSPVAALLADPNLTAQQLVNDMHAKKVVTALRSDREGASLRTNKAWKKLTGKEQFDSILKGGLVILNPEIQQQAGALIGNPGERTAVASRMAGLSRPTNARCEVVAKAVAAEMGQELAKTIMARGAHCLVVSAPAAESVAGGEDLERLHIALAEGFRNSVLGKYCEITTENPAGLRPEQEDQMRYASCRMAWVNSPATPTEATLQCSIEIKKKGNFAMTRVVYADRAQTFRFHPYRLEWIAAPEDDMLRRE